jgi:hypothetical protein
MPELAPVTHTRAPSRFMARPLANFDA